MHLAADNLTSSFFNLISGVGTQNDQSAHTHFCARPRSSVSMLEGAMRIDPILRNVIEAAPDDAIRAWRHWTDVDSDQLAEWDALEDELNYQDALETGLVYSEVYGGAVLIPSYDKSVVSLSDYGRAFKFDELPENQSILRGWLVYAASELKDAEQNFGSFKPSDPRGSFPEKWIIESKTSHLSLVMPTGVQNPAKQKTVIHSSWMLPIRGPRTLRHDKPKTGDGHFGESRIDIMFDFVNRAATSQAVGSTSLHKSTIDVFYADIGDRLAQCGGNSEKLQTVLDDVNTRLKQAMRYTSASHPVAMDKTSEKLERLDSKNTSNAMEPLIKMYVELLAAARPMPLTRALGLKQTGLSNSSDSDLAHWYDLVGSFRAKKMTRALKWMDRLVSHDRGIGIQPWKYGDLKPVDESKRAENALKNAQRDKIYAEDIGLPTVRQKIMTNLASSGVYKFTDEEIDSAATALDGEG